MNERSLRRDYEFSKASSSGFKAGPSIEIGVGDTQCGNGKEAVQDSISSTAQTPRAISQACTPSAFSNQYLLP